jgi:hypothetical protein
MITKGNKGRAIAISHALKEILVSLGTLRLRT